jgi:nicotinamide-nucleotide amidase
MNLATLTQVLIERSLTISVTESCTGGNLSSLLTSVSGSSAYFDRGYIAYSNQAKVDMLGVDPSTLTQFGAVSEQTAQAMVKGVFEYSNSDISVSITGIAGPTGGTQDKPVGMVCFGFYIKGTYFTKTQYFTGDRVTVIASSVDFVIQTLVDELSA